MKSILVVHHGGHHEDILRSVSGLLEKEGIVLSIAEREELREDYYQGRDMLIVIGGDGTFLRASHFNAGIPMLGINPNPKKREGFFMQATSEDYIMKLKKVLSGKFSVNELLRLRAEINGKPLQEHILNEIYIGGARPCEMFNYDIESGDTKEFHRGSGILIGTPAGSTAWLKSAGGQQMDIEERRFQFVARELYEGRITSGYKLRKGILDASHIVEITCRSKGIAVIDSVSAEYALEEGDRVRVYADSHPLKYAAVEE